MRSENIRVWQIEPINTFLLALDGAMLNGANYEPNAASFTCPADVTAAVVNPGHLELLPLPMERTLFISLQQPVVLKETGGLQLTSQSSMQLRLMLLRWNGQVILTGGGGWAAFTGAPVPGDFTSSTDATVTDVNGTPILIRIRILNNQWQTLVDQPITLALDGFLPPAYTTSDITGGVGPDACDPLAAFGRTAVYTVKACLNIAGTPQFLLNTNP
ncbi:MAG: hypothetical protein IPF68_20345 [Bacteroidales bacterium]|nr:hypothetical protein [Bacteroidales bacterium]